MENFNVVATWHEYVLAPEAERHKLEAAPGQIEAQKARRSARIVRPGKQSHSRRTRRTKIGSVSPGRGRCAALRTHSTCGRLQWPVAPPDAVQRASESFDRGNVTRTLGEGKSRTYRKDAKGPYFAEYDVTVAAGGRLPIGLAGRGDGRRDGRHPDQRRAGKRGQATRGKSRSLAGCRRLERWRCLR